MILLRVKETKNFMNKLLSSDCFDSFLLAEAQINTAASYTIDGHLNESFYTKDEWADSAICPYRFLCWKDAKALCFDLIKGKHTPVGFKIVLHLMPEHAAALLEKGDTCVTGEQLSAFVLTIKYDGSAATLTTGTAFLTFVPDKTPDSIWDHALTQFLYKKEIAVEEL